MDFMTSLACLVSLYAEKRALVVIPVHKWIMAAWLSIKPGVLITSAMLVLPACRCRCARGGLALPAAGAAGARLAQALQRLRRGRAPRGRRRARALLAGGQGLLWQQARLPCSELLCMCKT